MIQVVRQIVKDDITSRVGECEKLAAETNLSREPFFHSQGACTPASIRKFPLSYFVNYVVFL